MDPGIGTLGAIFSNVMSPLLISGGPVKSINQYYNKKLARLNTLLSQNKNTVVDHTTGDTFLFLHLPRAPRNNPLSSSPDF